MDTTMITKKLYNKSVQWKWEAQQKGIKPVKTFYDKIANVGGLSEMEGDPHIMTSGVGPTYFEELNEKAPIKFVDPVEGFTVYLKRKDYALGSETSMKLEDDMAIVKIDNFFKKYIQETVSKSAEPTIDNEFAKMFLYGGYTAGHNVFDNSTKALATGYTLFIYDGKPFFSLTGTAHTARGCASTYINSFANALGYGALKTADVALRSTNAYMENGRSLDMTGDGAIMVAPALGDTAMELMKSEKDPSNANNTYNAMKDRYEVIQNPYLSSLPAQWYLQKKNFGIQIFVNKDPQIRYWVEESTRVLRCSCVITMAMGVYNWHGSVGCNLATS